MLTKGELPACPVATTLMLIGSELGNTMRPIIGAMSEWGTMYQKLVKKSLDSE